MMKALHIVCGPPAAGKTHHARDLAERLGALCLDSDEVTEKLVIAGLKLAGLDPDDRDSPRYKAAYREVVYESLFSLAESHLERLPVVICGPFTQESQDPSWPQRLEQRFGAGITIHFVTCGDRERLARMKARAEARDQAKLLDWKAHSQQVFCGPPPFPHCLVTSRTEEG